MSALNFAFAIIATIGLCTFVGYKLNHVVIGIIVGFVLALLYLFMSVFKNGND